MVALKIVSNVSRFKPALNLYRVLADLNRGSNSLNSISGCNEKCIKFQNWVKFNVSKTLGLWLTSFLVLFCSPRIIDSMTIRNLFLAIVLMKYLQKILIDFFVGTFPKGSNYFHSNAIINSISVFKANTNISFEFKASN